MNLLPRVMCSDYDGDPQNKSIFRTKLLPRVMYSDYDGDPQNRGIFSTSLLPPFILCYYEEIITTKRWRSLKGLLELHY